MIGYGRVGSAIGDWLEIEGEPFYVIEAGSKAIDQLRARGIEAVAGNAASPELLRTANLGAARWLFVAVPNAFEAGQIVEQGRAANPELKIIARAHFDAEVEHLKQLGADIIIMGEREIARAMFDQAFAAPCRERRLVPHHTPLIATIVAGLVLAFVFGALANRLRALAAGRLSARRRAGRARTRRALSPTRRSPTQLAEIGVILLMFGVGLHFSLQDLLSVQAIAVPGRRRPDRGRDAARHGPRAGCSAGRSEPASCSASRCRSPAPWCCCARCRNATCSRPNAAASPSAG